MNFTSRATPMLPARIETGPGVYAAIANGTLTVGLDSRGLVDSPGVDHDDYLVAIQNPDDGSFAKISAAELVAEALPDLSGIFSIFGPIDGMSVITVASTIKTARVSGKTTAGDGAEGLFIRIAADPGLTVSDSDKFRSADRFLPDGTTSSGDGGWWRRKPETYAAAKANVWIPGRDYSLPVGYGTGTAAAINAAMAGVAARGGGKVIIPSENILLDATIDNKYAGVLLSAGDGSIRFTPDAGGAGGADPYGQGAQFIAQTSAPMFFHRTPFAAEMGGVKQRRNNGGGFEGITWNGNQLSANAVRVTSVWYGKYHGVARGIVGTPGSTYAVRFQAGVSNTDMDGPADVQLADIDLVIRCIDTAAERTTGGILLTGSANANFSVNKQVNFTVHHADGPALLIQNADNNFIDIRAFRFGGGTGATMLLAGLDALVGARSNNFGYVFGVGEISASGTDGGYSAGVHNTIQWLDTENGAPMPTAGVGSSWTVTTGGGQRSGASDVALAVGESTGQANLAKALRSSYPGASAVIQNASDLHLVMRRNSDVWREFINGTGDLALERLAGTGSLLLPLNLKFNGAAVTLGATDSGGTGYRALRVPNV